MFSHKKWSFVKSGIRILGCVIGFNSIPTLAIMFGIAEIIGILEELDED